MTKFRTKVFYHRSCFDGTMAAAIFLEHIQLNHLDREDFEFIAWEYGDPVPDVSGYRVILLDLTFDDADLEIVKDTAAYVLVVDHHPRVHQQVAKYRSGAPFNGGEGLRDTLSLMKVDFCTDSPDNPQSGAQLTWNFFLRGKEQPDFVRWIGKGDRWVFDEPEIRPFRLAIGTIGYDPTLWHSLFFGDPGNALGYVDKGNIMAEVIDGQLDYLMANCLSEVTIAGHTVVACNAPKFLASELGQRMYTGFTIEESPFVAVFYEEHGKLVYSLRSHRDSTIDLGELCTQFGGGGHFHAAGFKVNVTKCPLEPRVLKSAAAMRRWWHFWSK